MRRLLALAPALLAALTLTACAGVGVGQEPLKIGTDGKPVPRLYRIEAGKESEIQYRVLDSINTLRQTGGSAPLTLNPALIAAAKTHSRDMAVQNRPWHFGSDGSSPLERVRRSGYPGQLVGENISETFENEVETLSAWMAQTDTRAVVMDTSARDLGFAWYQEESGKIWWTLITGG